MEPYSYASDYMGATNWERGVGPGSLPDEDYVLAVLAAAAADAPPTSSNWTQVSFPQLYNTASLAGPPHHVCLDTPIPGIVHDAVPLPLNSILLASVQDEHHGPPRAPPTVQQWPVAHTRGLFDGISEEDVLSSYFYSGAALSGPASSHLPISNEPTHAL